MTDAFYQNIYLKYQVYNSLFLTLPFGDIMHTGTLLPLLAMKCENDLEEGSSPREVVEEFLDEHLPGSSEEDRNDLLFAFIKYVERQVVLFDAIEDASFTEVRNLDGQGTLTDLFNRTRMRDRLEALKSKLENFSLRVVLTAHPTQFYPGRVLSIISDLDDAISDNAISEINKILLQLGKTPMVQKTKPTPYTEAVRLIWYLENVFYDAIADMLEDLEKGMSLPLGELNLENLIKVGFWPGGDRDGNPYVNADTTLSVAHELRRSVLICYYNDIKKLKRKLTFKNVYEKIQEVSKKLSSGISEKDMGYRKAEELLNDLQEIKAELEEQDLNEFKSYLDQFIARARIFGLHFATIDIRQDSSIIDGLIEKLALIYGWVDHDEWKTTSEEKKIEIFKQAKLDLADTNFDDKVQMDVLESMSVMEKIVSLNGPRACQRYIISNSQSKLHVLQVLYLMYWRLGGAPFDVVPLFETVDDLAAAPKIMDELYNNPTYKKHLLDRGKVQTVMLGFSDGTKDGGFMRANWSIFRAKEEITRVSRENGIEVVFFDGRGGPPARGGGKSHRFYASLGSNIEDREVQITIQGQTISSNFGTRTSARYNLEQLFTAGLENSLFRGDIREIDDEGRKIIGELADISYDAYREFKDDEDFLPYLEQLGTLPYYGMTNIGSRPVKRSGSDKLTLKSLRAIPFVSSWNQMKQNVPGFYGLGTALQVFNARGDLDKVKKLYENTLFFKALIDNSMMALSKTYFPLTQYLEDHPQFGRLWKKIYEEYILAKDLVLEISGHEQLLEDVPNSRDSIRLREQVVLPILVIQQYALQKTRELEEEEKPDKANIYHTMVMRTMFAIINAGRNSA